MYLRNKYLCFAVMLMFSCSVMTTPVRARKTGRLKQVWAFLNTPVEDCVAMAWQKARTNVATTRQRIAALRTAAFRQGSGAFYDKLSQSVMEQVTAAIDEVGADQFCARVGELAGQPLPTTGSSPALKRAWLLRTLQKRLGTMRAQVVALRPHAVLGSIGSAECAVDELAAGQSVATVLDGLVNLGTSAGDTEIPTAGEDMARNFSSSKSSNTARGTHPVVGALANVLALMILLAVIGGAIFVVSQVGFGGVVAITFILFYFVYYLQM